MRIILVLMLVMGLCGVVRGEDYTDQVVKYHHCNCGFQTAYSAGVRDAVRFGQSNLKMVIGITGVIANMQSSL